MFTGIVQAIGIISAVDAQGDDLRLRVDAGSLDLHDTNIGDSISVSGVCLTVVNVAVNGFAADVSRETLACTTFADLRPGQRVNLEKALTPTSRLGGHLVSGHVDGVGKVLERRAEARSVRFRIQTPVSLLRYIAAKGSVCVDGASLTVNAVEGSEFELNIVPHTLRATTLDEWQAGRRVNIEVDLIARYLERLLLARESGPAPSSDPITATLLAEHGFLKK